MWGELDCTDLTRSSLALTWAKVGPSRAEIGAGHPKFGRSGLNLARFMPRLARSEGNLAEIGPIPSEPKSVELRSKLVKFGLTSAKFNQIWDDVDRTRRDFGQVSPWCGQICPKLAEIEQPSAPSAPNLTMFSEIWIVDAWS